MYYELKFMRDLARRKSTAFMNYAKVVLHNERVWDPDVLEEPGGVDRIKHECRCLIGWLRDNGLKVAPRKTNTGAWVQ